ncbi:metallophosphoesterase [Geminocystis sp. NIES-3709]|uniref:metallophosphoesterase family protein n=1 Tax=Geminocystis sp. NIES-3709 TaxID=1617448 RepID=UPI0005FCADB1|nr:metallophosphoesterase [Geminocystis sp. NIES-3709]BAQ63782.1 lipoprotein precursor [Geminocystis sp. NIES-3709]
MNVRFAIASDLHIALPETIDTNVNRFHLTQFSIPALEVVLQHLNTLNLDFLLLPGDLTQNGEIVNHQWLQAKLETLSYPVYVIPGNHDVPSLKGSKNTIAFQEFPEYYQKFGYKNTKSHDYTCELADGLQLVALNSNHFNEEEKQLGCLMENQLIWLEETLSKLTDKLVLVMIHHNVIEHLPNQSNHVLGCRYMLDNASQLLSILNKYQVRFIFTGHLHIQDIATSNGIHEITTGSLITYPHPYRILELKDNQLSIESHHITQLPDIKNLAYFSKKWTSDRSFPFMITMLTSPPLNLSLTEAKEYAPLLKNFWADIAHGDKIFDFTQLPPHINQYFQLFGAVDQDGQPRTIDNNIKIIL